MRINLNEVKVHVGSHFILRVGTDQFMCFDLITREVWSARIVGPLVSCLDLEFIFPASCYDGLKRFFIKRVKLREIPAGHRFKSLDTGKIYTAAHRNDNTELRYCFCDKYKIMQLHMDHEVEEQA